MTAPRINSPETAQAEAERFADAVETLRAFPPANLKQAVEQLVTARDRVSSALYGGAPEAEYVQRERDEADARDELRVILAMHGVAPAHAARMESAL